MRTAVWITLILVTVSAASARTWIVDQHGTGDFTFVRDALVSAGAGDSILIHPGTYDEYDGLVDPLTLEAKPLTLLGTGNSPEESALRLSVLFRQSGGCVVENLLFFDEGSPLTFNTDSDLGPLTVRRCRFEGNESVTSGGGAIRVIFGDLLVEDSMFIENICSDTHYELDRGGAIFLGAGSCIVRRCSFINNEAGGWGGAICCTGPVTIEDSIFIRNKADRGAAVMAFCESAMSRCTFSLNEVRNDYGATIEGFGECWNGPISHCIVTKTINGWGVECGYVKILECCDVWGNEAGDYQGTWCDHFEQDGNFSADPLFCDEENGDVRLREGSPCLPGQHGLATCEVVGAMGPGCQGLATGACCFVDGSCLLVEQSLCADQQGNYLGDGTTCAPNPCQSIPVQRATWGWIKAGYR
jgi:predicted outer membrane repeat protein